MEVSVEFRVFDIFLLFFKQRPHRVSCMQMSPASFPSPPPQHRALSSSPPGLLVVPQVCPQLASHMLFSFVRALPCLSCPDLTSLATSRLFCGVGLKLPQDGFLSEPSLPFCPQFSGPFSLLPQHSGTSPTGSAYSQKYFIECFDERLLCPLCGFTEDPAAKPLSVVGWFSCLH